MKPKTRGECEAEFTRSMTRLEKEYLGRGPSEVRTFIIEDMIVVRIRGVLTPAEAKMAETSDGRALVKETRRRLFEVTRPLIEAAVRDIVQCEVLSLHSDISTKTGERIVVLTVDTNLGERFA